MGTKLSGQKVNRRRAALAELSLDLHIHICGFFQIIVLRQVSISLSFWALTHWPHVHRPVRLFVISLHDRSYGFMTLNRLGKNLDERVSFRDINCENLLFRPTFPHSWYYCLLPNWSVQLLFHFDRWIALSSAKEQDPLRADPLNTFRGGQFSPVEAYILTLGFWSIFGLSWLDPNSILVPIPSLAIPSNSFVQLLVGLFIQSSESLMEILFSVN